MVGRRERGVRVSPPRPEGSGRGQETPPRRLFTQALGDSPVTLGRLVSASDALSSPRTRPSAGESRSDTTQPLARARPRHQLRLGYCAGNARKRIRNMLPVRDERSEPGPAHHAGASLFAADLGGEQHGALEDVQLALGGACAPLASLLHTLLSLLDAPDAPGRTQATTWATRQRPRRRSSTPTTLLLGTARDRSGSFRADSGRGRTGRRRASCASCPLLRRLSFRVDGRRRRCLTAGPGRRPGDLLSGQARVLTLSHRPQLQEATRALLRIRDGRPVRVLCAVTLSSPSSSDSGTEYCSQVSVEEPTASLATTRTRQTPRRRLSSSPSSLPRRSPARLPLPHRASLSPLTSTLSPKRSRRRRASPPPLL